MMTGSCHSDVEVIMVPAYVLSLQAAVQTVEEMLYITSRDVRAVSSWRLLEQSCSSSVAQAGSRLSTTACM